MPKTLHELILINKFSVKKLDEVSINGESVFGVLAYESQASFNSNEEAIANIIKFETL